MPSALRPPLEKYVAAIPKMQEGLESYAEKLKSRGAVKDVDGLEKLLNGAKPGTTLLAKIKRGEVFVIMGGSGCGKSTMMTILIGLKAPARGKVYYGEVDFWGSDQETRDRIIRRAGVMYQSGALWRPMPVRSRRTGGDDQPPEALAFAASARPCPVLKTYMWSLSEVTTISRSPPPIRASNEARAISSSSGWLHSASPSSQKYSSPRLVLD